MKQNTLRAVVLAVATAIGTSSAYTSRSAEDAFFWHYWEKVFLRANIEVPDWVDDPEDVPDFGLFFVNTSRFNSFWAAIGVGPVVWGASMFIDKIEPTFTPFPEETETNTTARMVLGVRQKNFLNSRFSFQAGGYVLMGGAPPFTGERLLEHPEFREYTEIPETFLTLGTYFQYNYDAPRIVSQLQWIAGLRDALRSPTKALLNWGIKKAKSMAGPYAALYSSDTASTFQTGFTVANVNDFAPFTLKLIHTSRQQSSRYDFDRLGDALTRLSLWSYHWAGESPKLDFGLDHSRILYGFWNSDQDGFGWKIGLAHYFNEFLHMDISLAYNEWEADPIVGKTDSYKLVIDYFF